MGHLERWRPSLECLHSILLVLSLLFRGCCSSQYQLPLSPCLEFTSIITKGLLDRLGWKRLGPFGRFLVWLWQWSPIHGWSSCWIRSSWCRPGIFITQHKQTMSLYSKPCFCIRDLLYSVSDVCSLQALPLVSTFWGVVLFGEYRRSSKITYILLGSMLFMFIVAVAVLMASSGHRK